MNVSSPSSAISNLDKIVAIVVFRCIMFTFAIFGNSFKISIILRSKKLQNEKMNLLIVLGDVILASSVPVKYFFQLVYGDINWRFMCLTIHTFIV
ncbi:hypothetical protein L596_023707 [Steinernema carpocapsae]|uniref:G-protein coupled receptors family 1 profile domain-containing protein n=1 Tax=Steinernema carpocapsae TaxID=34508 RepID=A0A4V5ZZI8_STECR|nr:hypothetical protein L596_023707 [Steinernema carpocapsae]